MAYVINLKGTLKTGRTLKGRMVARLTLSASFPVKKRLRGHISKPKKLKGTIKTDVEKEYYEGDYIVIPKAFEDQDLTTLRKYMTGDVLVKEIPYSEVSNLAGGITVNIG